MGGEDVLKSEYEKLLRREDGAGEEDVNERLNKLKELVLFKGLPDCASLSGSCGRGSLRGTVWKALLGIGEVNVDHYKELVSRGPSVDYQKIAIDVARTFSKHEEYTSRVPREMLVRLLNALVHERGNEPETYLQSMSVLAAPFLFLMTEPEAFLSFDVFLTERIPNYVFKYIGVHRGCNIMNKLLRQLDPELYTRFCEFKLVPQTYAFPNISSLGMCVLPLSDSLRLLDVQLAYGSHLGVLFSLGRLVLARGKIIRVKGKIPIITRDMQTGFGFNSRQVLSCTMQSIIPQIDEELYVEVENHTGELGD
uniref:Rab-GAP TBC domain-containing protein n=1 Tax=Rhodosorus marinus TaxID=101924 RepID=A0A7S2ZM69_9RHOD|mmetsp:Transcript_21871/g.89001  ORF Transcript_21871/g.89001 Transcript_21871/m.89001 type:complete len:309 (+) Transcript_21871:582-1508(+)|eukprot:CAMPEP_0113969820 /NCGR_PEP_ID=MMETSP0011_2-20120614/10618_1 /TAXON_ID=101924 /ORGANISM="Rhodosorus marinus" /LENGTH=308 /DNA_ID=CAMNT_0000983697 /DNA_START=409 /DNA_END=1335 /DNA_ORIENTATION=+ /assembly_acc=CAM_ASM_000156